MVRRKTKKAKGKTKGRKAGTRRAPKKRKAAGATASSQTGTKRIAALEAENRRLRKELESLRTEQSERPVPAFNLTADEGEPETQQD
jgi:hypothetical protein